MHSLRKLVTWALCSGVAFTSICAFGGSSGPQNCPAIRSEDPQWRDIHQRVGQRQGRPGAVLDYLVPSVPRRAITVGPHRKRV